jgi:cytochrome o ubiquinol oxidase subunit 1
MGMTRRMQHTTDPSWEPMLWVAGVGALIILAGIVFQIIQLVVSIRTRDQRRDLFGDPWDGRSLEWATTSPPPSFNFAVLPNVSGEEAYWSMKQRAIRELRLGDEPDYQPIEMPRNSPTGFVVAFFATLVGFGLIWHIWWLVIAGLLGAYATFVVFAWRDRGETEIPVEEVRRQDQARRRSRTDALSRRAAT